LDSRPAVDTTVAGGDLRGRARPRACPHTDLAFDDFAAATTVIGADAIPRATHAGHHQRRADLIAPDAPPFGATTNRRRPVDADHRVGQTAARECAQSAHLQLGRRWQRHTGPVAQFERCRAIRTDLDPRRFGQRHAGLHRPAIDACLSAHENHSRRRRRYGDLRQGNANPRAGHQPVRVFHAIERLQQVPAVRARHETRGQADQVSPRSTS
jgi:hypothetical protein